MNGGIVTEEELHRKITRDVSQTMDLKLDELRRLQAEYEKRQRREVEEAEQRVTKAAAERKQVQEEKLDALFQLQVESAEARNKRQQLWNRLLATLVTVLTATAGGGIYLGTRRPTEEEKAEEAAPVIREVERESKEVEKRVEKAEQKIERLKDVALEQQVQISDSTEYIVEKIDAAHPKTADSVEKPESLKRAKTKADAIKRKRAAEKKVLFEEDTDPFAGID